MTDIKKGDRVKLNEVLFTKDLVEEFGEGVVVGVGKLPHQRTLKVVSKNYPEGVELMDGSFALYKKRVLENK